MRKQLRTEYDPELASRKGKRNFLAMEPSGSAKEFTSLNKKRDIFLIFCGTLSVLAGVCGGLCALAFGMALVEGSDEVQRQLSQELPWEDRLMTLAKHFLRLVGVRAAEGCRFPFSEKHPYEFTRVFPSGIFCSAMVIITETEWRRVMQFCPFLEFWSARGLFQLYVAALLYAIVHTDKTDDFSRSVMLYRVVASAGMCFMGTFYIFAGILCVGSLKQSRQRREEERERALHDLEDLERRRLELRGMLSLGE